ncbi:MAG: histidinol-phosphate transaminase [Peptoniphilus sp.]|nr:histidinol-phosphate transaminase [Peptoniphilus sp.]
MIEPRKAILNVTPYVPGKPAEQVMAEFNLDDVVKLASNENPIGTSQKVIDALIEYIKTGVNIYPDGSSIKIRKQIAEHFNLKPENILMSNGADDALGIIAQTFLTEGDEVLISEYSFARYGDNSKIMGATIKEIPMKDFKFNLEAMKKAINEKTKLIWLCNPNNPTGTMLTEEEVIPFIESVPKNIIIVYDTAYGEYVTSDKYPKDSIHFFEKYPNVLTVKTFSKIYGLAGLRVGYVVSSPEINDLLNRTRQPFNCNVLSQIAAGVALEDEEFVKKAYDLNKEGKEYLYALFEEVKLPYVESEANHIFFEVPGIPSQDLSRALEKEGIIVRPQKNSFIRLTIGTMEENKLFAEKLKKVLGELK